MSELTEAERARLRELADAATPGPWHTEPDGPEAIARMVWVGQFPIIECAAADQWMFEGKADAEFIAAARTAVPALLAENHRLRAGIDALAGNWERLARNGPATYAEIRRAHATDLRALLSTSSVRGEGDG